MQIFDKGLDSSWIGYMTGQVEFNTELISNNKTAIMKLKSRNDHTRHAIFTGGIYYNAYFYFMYVFINEKGVRT